MVNMVIHNEAKYPDTIKIHHYKAPTDASIKLLNEFQEKALANIISHVKVKTNLVEGDVLLYANPMVRTTKLILKFNLNGKDFVFTEDLKDVDFHFDAKVASRKLIERFSLTVIETLLVDSPNDFTRFIGPKMVEQTNNR